MRLALGCAFIRFWLYESAHEKQQRRREQKKAEPGALDRMTSEAHHSHHRGDTHAPAAKSLDAAGAGGGNSHEGRGRDKNKWAHGFWDCCEPTPGECMRRVREWAGPVYLRSILRVLSSLNCMMPCRA